MKFRVRDKSLGKQWLKKKCMRIAQAAFILPLLGCHRALCWCGCQAYTKPLNRYVNAHAGMELGIWLQAALAHPWHWVMLWEAALLGLPAVQPGCPDLLGQGGLSDTLLKRVVGRSGCGQFLFF